MDETVWIANLPFELQNGGRTGRRLFLELCLLQQWLDAAGTSRYASLALYKVIYDGFRTDINN